MDTQRRGGTLGDGERHEETATKLPIVEDSVFITQKPLKGNKSTGNLHRTHSKVMKQAELYVGPQSAEKLRLSFRINWKEYAAKNAKKGFLPSIFKKKLEI